MLTSFIYSGTDFRNHFPTLMPHIIRILTSPHFHKVRETSPTHVSVHHQSSLPLTAAGIGPSAASQASVLPPLLVEALRLNFPSGRSALGASPVVPGGSPWNIPPAPTTIPLASISGLGGPSVAASAPSSPAPSPSSTQEPPTLASSPMSSLMSPPLPNPAAVDLLVLEEVLKLLQQMGPNLDDLLHLVLPHVVQLLDCPTLPLVSLRYGHSTIPDINICWTWFFYVGMYCMCFEY